ncbi:hypothetical protein M885DRAFT_541900 [Pelagophyceae sp. CCMP2097]|nr:hypothetical protein M885DRAFT_541900 [Pelagophyceae sp. CCMP2097]
MAKLLLCLAGTSALLRSAPPVRRTLAAAAAQKGFGSAPKAKALKQVQGSEKMLEKQWERYESLRDKWTPMDVWASPKNSGTEEKLYLVGTVVGESAAAATVLQAPLILWAAVQLHPRLFGLDLDFRLCAHVPDAADRETAPSGPTSPANCDAAAQALLALMAPATCGFAPFKENQRNAKPGGQAGGADAKTTATGANNYQFQKRSPMPSG